MPSSNVWFTLGAVLAAFPFGYMAGLLAAILSARGTTNFGQAPLLTVPIGILAAIVFAVVPVLSARTRFAILFVGTIALHLMVGAIV